MERSINLSQPDDGRGYPRFEFTTFDQKREFSQKEVTSGKARVTLKLRGGFVAVF
jgi:hypothetical protein